MKIRASLIAAASLLASGGAQGSGFNRPPAAAYSQEEIAAALGLHRSEGSISWQDADQQCVASVIMTDRKTIKIYSDAGDPVATNPSGTVGVKVGAYAGVDKRMCFDRFAEALKKLR
ncbi:MAG TPA: hypothetical protein VFQ67_03135 [Allosphingosinicella sp.]|jgi:hypothetical protein|nr:hypothetical protein [Allosphingosinicella sp.]